MTREDLDRLRDEKFPSQASEVLDSIEALDNICRKQGWDEAVEALWPVVEATDARAKAAQIVGGEG